MTSNDETDDDGGGLSRRRLLRTGATAGALGLGAALGATPAAATSNCPRPRQYWASHDWPPHVENHLGTHIEIAGRTRSKAVWKLMLGMDLPDDRTAAMAQQLLTAKINLLLRPSSDPDCVNRELEAYDGRTVEGARNAAADWLLHSTFGEPEDQDCWTVETDDGPIDGGPLFQLLGHFNHGDLDELDCGCYRGEASPAFRASFDDDCESSSFRPFRVRQRGLVVTTDGQLLFKARS